MTRQHSLSMKRDGFFKRMGYTRWPPRSHSSWRKEAWIRDEFHPQGILADVTPAPGHTFTRDTWPPRGRGRGESLTSPRRIEAKIRASRVLEMRQQGHTWEAIARALGYRDKSGPYRLLQRSIERIDHDKARREYWLKYR